MPRLSVSPAPLVTIITPNFNGMRFIRRCVESVRRQNYSVEHIIVDDCSSDGSWELLQELAKEFVWLKPVRLEKNTGPVAARNRAIELAQGRFLAFLDVDDFWLPDKLATQVQFMMNKDCASSFSDYRFVTDDGLKIGRRLHGFNQIGWHLHHMTRYLGCLTIVLDRSKLLDFRIPEISRECLSEDFPAWSSCILKVGPVVRCPHDLARYSIVPDSRSSNAVRSAWWAWMIYRDIEKIPLVLAAFYFVIYATGVIWKRYRFRPCINREAVDTDFMWSLLR